MCGIVGRVSAGAPVERELVERMCAALEHRGPDSRGVHVEGQAGLGIQRLAIIDLVTGDQPMYSEDGAIVLVLNGEIYNHIELRDELLARGHSFSSRSDAEVVVHLWEEIGPRCVERLRGMFAFAIWDERRRELFVARDRIGKKPLFWAHHRGVLSFASEPRSLFQDDSLPREVNLTAVDCFLVNQYVPHSMSAFRFLHKLPPGSTLSWRPGEEPRIERYWRLEYEPKHSLAFEDAATCLRELILEATRLRMISDVPIGAFLSGGVDSSVVVAAMALNSSEPVRTFSAAFPGTGVDETPHARRVAERYATDHHELEVAPADAALLPRIAWHFGEPFADPAALPTFQLSELIRGDVTVALNGDGGDESFAGYGRYRQLAATLRFEALPLPVRRAAARSLARLAGGTDGRAPLPRAARLARRMAMAPARRYADLFRYFRDDDRERLYTPELLAATSDGDPLAHVEAAWSSRAGLDPIDRLMAVDLDTYLADDLLAKVDVTSMAQSLEVRSPLLDHELMEFSARLPEQYKRRGDEGKLLLRHIARDWLPDDVLDRRKQGFAVPLGDWLRKELRALPEDVLLDPVAHSRGLFRTAEVRRMIDEHRQGRDRADQLWAMINLELWYRTCVDAAPTRAADVPALA